MSKLLVPVLVAMLCLAGVRTGPPAGGSGSTTDSNVIEIKHHEHFENLMKEHNSKLVIVDFTAKWCGPCRMIAPLFAELSKKYTRAKFLKVDTDDCNFTAQAKGVNAMPTFVFYVNNVDLGRIEGANKKLLESKTENFNYDGEGDADDGKIAEGFMNLAFFIDHSRSECRNASKDHPLSSFLQHADRHLRSDADEQLIIALDFKHPVKIVSLKVRAPTTNGPKKVRLFVNRPHTLDFDDATSHVAAQELELKPEDLKGETLDLSPIKFQSVLNLQIFVESNQNKEEENDQNKEEESNQNKEEENDQNKEEESNQNKEKEEEQNKEYTRIDSLVLVGTPIPATNVGDLKQQ